MKIKQDDGSYTPTVGFIDIGDLLVPRAKLVTTLPDFKRFERWLETAKRFSQYMSDHDGEIPPEAKAMSVAERRAVGETMRELGELHCQAGQACLDEIARRNAAHR